MLEEKTLRYAIYRRDISMAFILPSMESSILFDITDFVLKDLVNLHIAG